MKNISSFFRSTQAFLTKGKTLTFSHRFTWCSPLCWYFSSPTAVFLPAFLGSAWFIYWLPMDQKFKLGIGIVVALFIVPILGVRNIFYFEVISRSVFCRPGPGA